MIWRSNLLSLSCLSKISFANEEKFFKQFKKLTKLIFSNNILTYLPSTISRLKSLEYLDISHNKISFDNIIDCFMKLNNLKWFILDNLKFDMNDAKLVKIPASLKYLEISSLKHSRIPFDIENTELVTFKCTGVPLIDKSLFNKRNPMSVKAAVEFYQNIFSEEQVTQIFNSIHSQTHEGSRSKVTYLDEVESIKFSASVYKSFPRIDDLSPSEAFKDFSSGIRRSIFTLVSLKVDY